MILPMYTMVAASDISLRVCRTRWLFLLIWVGFAKADWSDSNLRVCRRGEWNDRMLIESILSMLTVDLKKVRHRCWTYFKTRLGFTMALFNLLVQWDGLPADEDGFVPYQLPNLVSKLAPKVIIKIADSRHQLQWLVRWHQFPDRFYQSLHSLLG